MPVVTELRRFPVKSCRGEVLSEAARRAVGPAWGPALDARRRPRRSGDDPRAQGHGAAAPRAARGRRPAGPGHRPRGRGRAGRGRPVRRRPGPGQPVRRHTRSWPPWPTTPRTSGSARRWASRCGWCTPTTPRDGRRTRRTRARASRWRSPTAIPLHLASEESLADLNDRVLEGPMADQGPLPMVRFRPNVVVSGAPAWAEDGWRRLRIGDGRLPLGQGLRALHDPDHRRADRRAVQGADRDDGALPALGRGRCGSAPTWSATPPA